MIFSKKELQDIKRQFKKCSSIFLAFGDETRQKLFLDIVLSGENGIGVKELTASQHLSRPAISHHLKVLKNCRLIDSKKNGVHAIYTTAFLENNFNDIEDLIRAIQIGIKRIRENQKK